MAARKQCPIRISPDTLERAALTLRVLAHPQRLRLVELLLERQVPVGALAELAELPPAAVSQHLSNMRASGIVERRREGRTVYYRVIEPSAIALLECIRRHNS